MLLAVTNGGGQHYALQCAACRNLKKERNPEVPLQKQMPRLSVSLLLFLLLFLFLPEAWSYEAPKVKQDVFATRACPAFLTYVNTAHLAGATVELPCPCKPPQVQSVVWFFKKHLDGPAETRALTDHHGNRLLDPSRVPQSGSLRNRFSIRLFSLLIFRASPEDAGVYICGSARDDFFYAYDVDIQEARRLSFVPSLSTGTREQTGTKGPGSAQPLYRVFTSFRPWSVCDRCGAPGEQVRAGLCYVRSHFLHVRYRRANQTAASCGSGAVPRGFRLRRHRVGAELEVKGCQVTCPTEGPRPSKVDVLMSFLGYNSAFLPAEVPVLYLSHPADRVLTLGCPEARSNMAVAWDRGSDPIYRFHQSAGRDAGAAPSRLQIDAGHHLVFRPAKTEDSGIYHCWLQGRRAAQIRLLVYRPLGRGQSVTSHPDFPRAVRTVLTSYAVMTAVFCLLLFGKAGIKHLRDAESHVD